MRKIGSADAQIHCSCEGQRGRMRFEQDFRIRVTKKGRRSIFGTVVDNDNLSIEFPDLANRFGQESSEKFFAV